MSSWQAKARKWWRKADWIQGDGPFAVLAPCRVLTVTLWETRAGAEEAKKSIDKAGCGGKCNPWQHKIIDMSLSVGQPVRSARGRKVQGSASFDGPAAP